MPTYTQYQGGSATNFDTSAAIWGDCPVNLMDQEPMNYGRHFFDDFIGVGTASLTDTTKIDAPGFPLGYSNVLDSSVTLTWEASQAGATGQDTGRGIMRGTTTAVDLDFWALGLNEDADGGFARMNAGSDRAWFEARIRLDTVANNELGWFIGLAEVGTVLDQNLDDNTSELISGTDYVGWQVLTADGNAMLPIFQEGGNTKVVVGTGTNGSGAGTAVLVAAEYVKVGFKFNGSTDGGTIKYYIDGVVNSQINIVSTDNFPDVNYLCPVALGRNGSAAAVLFDIDWWRAAYSPRG